ncbi:MAG TPA: hypothetical protein VJ464_16005 [Blastocatellia bacterium]|nr:hypothetical protein [Blastocatellia bacterium]
MEIWLTAKDLLGLGAKPATIYRKTASGEWVSRRAKPKGPGQPSREYLLDSLPADIQLAWAKLDGERRAGAAPIGIDDETSSGSPTALDSRLSALVAALSRFSPPQYTLEEKDAVQRRCVALGKLCDQAIALIARLKSISVVSPGSREAGKDRAYHPNLAQLAARSASTDSLYLEMYPSAAKPLSTSTFLRLIDKYRTDGPVVFIPKGQTLSPDNDKRFLNVPQEAVDWLHSNLKSYEKASLTEFGRAWLAAAGRKNWKLPFADHRPGAKDSCYTWLYRWRQKVPATTVTMITKGERGFEATYAWIQRQYEDLKPRDGFTMDWRIFDMMCWVPAKKGGGKPALVRRWFCPVLDLASRAIFGFHIDDRPSARGVTLAYLNAIGDAAWKTEPGLELLRGMQRSRDGMQAFVHFDNGKDFRAKSIEGRMIQVSRFDLEDALAVALNAQDVGLAAEVQLRIRHAKPFNAKSKIIETWFRIIAEWEKTQPGYAGNKPENRPHYFKAAVRLHEAFCKRKDGSLADYKQLPELWREAFDRNKEKYKVGTPFLSEDDLKAGFTSRLLEYLHRPHGSLMDDIGEMSPLDHLRMYADTPHMMTSTTTAALLMTPMPATVRGAIITIQWNREKFFYKEVASDLSDGGALYRLPQSTKVEFRVDDNNRGRGMVLTGGTPLCWVENKELLGWNATAEDFKRANAEKKFARKVANEFFETQTNPADWRDIAAERMPEALPIAVGAGDVFDPSESDDQPPGSVTVITRFDRKSPDAPARPALLSPLRVVPDPLQERDDFDSLKSFDSGADTTEIKAEWER